MIWLDKQQREIQMTSQTQLRSGKKNKIEKTQLAFMIPSHENGGEQIVQQHKGDQAGETKWH